MTIKAIETRYGGYRFRSRLEARWAVFFDELGVPWDYEPQGFDLGRAGLYLPDFWLENHGCWFEVKGEKIKVGGPEDNLMRAFRDQSETPVILAFGSMGTFPHVLYAFDVTESTGGSNEWAGRWTRAYNTKPLAFGVKEDPDHRTFFGDPGMDRHLSWVEATPDAQVTPRVRKAYMAARGARFEHGENGRR